MAASSKSSFVHAVVVAAGCCAIILGILSVASSPASASPLACGATITASVKLTANINCTGDTTDNGINIGGPDVTVNLNGFSILGPGAAAGTYGIADLDAFDDITLENGTISNFNIDIETLGGSSTAELTGLVVENIDTTNDAPQESYGVYGEYLDGASIHNLSISDADIGIELDDSESSTVSSNQLVEPYYGLDDFEGMGNFWSDNSISDGIYDGVEVYGSTGTAVESNTVKGDLTANGVYEFESQDSIISDNVLDSLYDGLYEDDSGPETVSHNTGSSDFWGIYSYDMTDPTYVDNQFNKGNYGIETDFPTGEVLQGNVTNHNSEFGVFVYTEDETTGYSASLTDNTANDNQYGLYSEIATTGHSNKASGNTTINCYNVHCVKAKTTIRGADAIASPVLAPVTPRTIVVAPVAPRVSSRAARGLTGDCNAVTSSRRGGDNQIVCATRPAEVDRDSDRRLSVRSYPLRVGQTSIRC